MCVVGGGFSGVNTALELAQRGFSVVLLEAHRIGWGASGRNGGQLIRGVGHDVEQFLPVIGADGVKALKLMGLEAVEIVRRRVEQYAIDCDLRWGYCDLANKPGDYQGFREDMEELRPSAIATRCAWCRPRRCAAWSAPIATSAAWWTWALATCTRSTWSSAKPPLPSRWASACSSARR